MPAINSPYVAVRQAQDGSCVVGNGYRGAGSDYDVTLNAFQDLRHFLLPFLANLRSLSIKLRAGAVFSPERYFSSEPEINERKLRRNIGYLEQYMGIEPADAGFESWAGFIDVTPDTLPYFGVIPDLKAIVCCGFSGYGFAMGPGAGAAIAQIVTQGRADVDLHAYRLDRF